MASDEVVVGMSKERLLRLQNKIDECINKGLLSGASVAVLRKNKLIHESYHGYQNPQIPTSPDTIYRIYSMTKPIVSCALMILYEKGKFKLTDPVKLYIPSFDKTKMKGIYCHKTNNMVPIKHNIQIWHLLTHTSGISYGFDKETEDVDKFYFDKNGEWNLMRSKRMKSSEFIDDELSQMPLLFEPGTEWQYSLSTDICGRLVEVLSGKSLDVFLEENIFKPLSMNDTSFYIPNNKKHRFASIYMPSPKDNTKLIELSSDSLHYEYDQRKQIYCSGGGGLVSTLNDYMKFSKMLLNKGYCIDNGKQILSRKTIEFMTQNHLPNNQSTMNMSHDKNGGIYQSIAAKGSGFGLGFSVVINNTTSDGTSQLPSIGSFGWAGAASTHFWIDKKEELVCVFMTQLRYNDKRKFDIRDMLYRFVYASLVDDKVTSIKSKL